MSRGGRQGESWLQHKVKIEMRIYTFPSRCNNFLTVTAEDEDTDMHAWYYAVQLPLLGLNVLTSAELFMSK